MTTYRCVNGDAPGEVVGRQSFRIFKFDPNAKAEPGARSAGGGAAKPAELLPEPGEQLPDFDLDVTATVVVSGAIASRDFMPVHHDRDYAQAQGAPDIFMNILASDGYVARYVTDWAGPQRAASAHRRAPRSPCLPGPRPGLHRSRRERHHRGSATHGPGAASGRERVGDTSLDLTLDLPVRRRSRRNAACLWQAGAHRRSAQHWILASLQRFRGVFVGGLPDKTAVASLILGSRSRPLPVSQCRSLGWGTDPASPLPAPRAVWMAKLSRPPSRSISSRGWRADRAQSYSCAQTPSRGGQGRAEEEQQD